MTSLMLRLRKLIGLNLWSFLPYLSTYYRISFIIIMSSHFILRLILRTDLARNRTFIKWCNWCHLEIFYLLGILNCRSIIISCFCFCSFSNWRFTRFTLIIMRFGFDILVTSYWKFLRFLLLLLLFYVN